MTHYIPIPSSSISFMNTKARQVSFNPPSIVVITMPFEVGVVDILISLFRYCLLSLDGT